MDILKNKISDYIKFNKEEIANIKISSKLENTNVLKSLEVLTSKQENGLFVKEAEQYFDKQYASTVKLVDIFCKGSRLYEESIAPIVKAHMAFTDAYGDSVAESIVNNAKINYYRCVDTKIHSYPAMVLGTLISDIQDLNTYLPKLKLDLIKYMGCEEYSDGSLGKPNIKGIIDQIQTEKTISELGYDYDNALNGLSELCLSGSMHIFEQYASKVKDTLYAMKNNSKFNLGNIQKNLVEYPIDGVEAFANQFNQINSAIYSSICLHHATSYAAYEAAYIVHAAEINYSKTN